MYWAKEFSSRLSVHSNTFKIVLPLDRLINITSINQLKISNWLEIEGVIDVGQKNLNIQYNANDTFGATSTFGKYPPFSSFGTENRTCQSFRSNCKDTEKKR
jgi:hypothetical protein